VIVGNRIPRTFFHTEGVGQSEITTHAGSYHMALREAGIEMCNIIVYSSILPGTAKRVDRPPRSSFVHGEVMETIMAVSTARYGETATAGLTYGWLYDGEGNRYGGLVCEYNGSMPEHEAHDHLGDMLDGLHQNGYDHLRLDRAETLIRQITPNQMYGTALVALCFTSYEWPELPEYIR
jgi:arginine decarboxylase